MDVKGDKSFYNFLTKTS